MKIENDPDVLQEWVYRQTIEYPYSGILLRNRNKTNYSSSNNLDELQRLSDEWVKPALSKGYMLYYSLICYSTKDETTVFVTKGMSGSRYD